MWAASGPDSTGWAQIGLLNGTLFFPPPTRFPYGDTSDRVMGNDWFIVNISASVQRSTVAAMAQHWRLVRTTFAFTPKWDGLARKPSDRRASLNTDLSHQAVAISTPQIQTLRVENKLTMPLLPTVVLSATNLKHEQPSCFQKQCKVSSSNASKRQPPSLASPRPNPTIQLR